MQILYLSGFKQEEIEHCKDIVFLNIVNSAKSLIEGAEKLKIPIENMEIVKEIKKQGETPQMSETYVANLRMLWKDDGIQKAFARSSEFQLNDSTGYFMDELDRITAQGYVPNEQDVLRCRAKTTGITEIEFKVGQNKFKLVDVGGQRSERKKWIHCFQDVTAVLFCVSLSEFDQKLYEDETVNRIDESLKLFDEICNSHWFEKNNIILFLNKKDLFMKKLETKKLSDYFHDYTGPNNYESAIKFFTEKFLKLNKNPQRREIYTHVTCATDTKNVEFVFSAIKDMLLKDILLNGGVL